MKASLKRINHFFQRVVIPKLLYPAETTLLTTGTKIVLLSGLAATLGVTGLKLSQVIEPAELHVFDRIVRSQPDQAIHPRITIIGMSEGDIRQYGWPLSDALLARALEEIQSHQPSVVGLDLYRSTLRPPGSAALVEQLAAPNLIAIKNVGNDPHLGEVPPPPTVPSDRIGFNDLPTDSDGIIRRNLLYVRGAEDGHYSFGLRVVLADAESRGNPRPLSADDHYLHLGDLPIRVLSGREGGYQAVDSSGYQILLRYQNRHRPDRQISISQILSGQYDPTWIEGNVVLIGTTAASLKDRFFTPFSFNQDDDLTMPGVIIHAQMISQLMGVLEGQPALYRYLPPWSEGLWLLGWCLAAGTLIWTLRRPSLLIGSTVLLSAGLVGLGWVAVNQLVWLPLVEPMVGILATSSAVIAYKLLYRSTHDPLTGLPNREAFIGSIQRALRQHPGTDDAPPVIVVFMGIDRFKVINESLGHQAGDRVLRITSQRLTQHMPLESKVARVGGDEFALLLTQWESDRAGAEMDRLQYTLSEPIVLQGQRLPSAISMGMAISQVGMAHKPADLLRDAHTAMYRAKALGKSRFEVFAAGMLTEAVNRLQLESDLLSALDNQEFLLYYQPIIRLSTGELAGFEALVRWHQKDRGFVLPSAFIPAAEETGLIMALGQWIFREACRQLRHWHDLFPQYPRLTMSINLSNRQFGQADLVQQIKTALQDTQVRGDCVRLEITESMVMGDVDAAIDLMLKLKSLDLKLAIDDFGTGYSSLSYLHRFPMDTLKVDKSFVGRLERSNEDRAIIHTILTLGQKLGMEVVAEGVETLEQVNMLKQEHCDYGQGYFFAKPLPAEAAEALLKQRVAQSLRQA